MSTCLGVPDIELQRSPDDRRLYALEGIGTLRLRGVFARTATAEAGDKSWRIARRGFWQRGLRATDPQGATIGEFEPGRLRRGGALRWAGRELALRPTSKWRERYALAETERELVILDGKGWGKRPVRITLDDPGAVEAGLLLFATYVVRGLAEDAGSAATVVATSS